LQIKLPDIQQGAEGESGGFWLQDLMLQVFPTSVLSLSKIFVTNHPLMNKEYYGMHYNNLNQVDGYLFCREKYLTLTADWKHVH